MLSLNEIKKAHANVNEEIKKTMALMEAERSKLIKVGENHAGFDKYTALTQKLSQLFIEEIQMRLVIKKIMKELPPHSPRPSSPPKLVQKIRKRYVPQPAIVDNSNESGYVTPPATIMDTKTLTCSHPRLFRSAPIRIETNFADLAKDKPCSLLSPFADDRYESFSYHSPDRGAQWFLHRDSGPISTPLLKDDEDNSDVSSLSSDLTDLTGLTEFEEIFVLDLEDNKLSGRSTP